LSGRKSGTTATGYLNGSLTGTKTVPATMVQQIGQMVLGNRAGPTFAFNGQIAEVLVYNRALTDAERSQIEQQLMTKYGALPIPLVASGLRAWYRADYGVTKNASNQVSQVADLSGNGFHVRNADSTRWPGWTANAMNGAPALEYSANRQLLTDLPVDVQGGSNNSTVIAVVNPAATQSQWATIWNWGGVSLGEIDALNQYGLASWDNGSMSNSPPISATTGRVQVLSALKNGTVATGYLNGSLVGTNTMPAALPLGASPVALGNGVHPYYAFNGQIAEVLVYNRALTDAERAQIEQQLMTKYMNPDSDDDGLSDTWEVKYLGTLSYGANDDPGAVGRTLLQSYQQNLSPWPTASVASGLRAWYRADYGVTKNASNQVSQVADLSGNGFHVRNTDSTRWPGWTANAMNGAPALEYSANRQLLTDLPVDVQGSSNDSTVIAVVNPGATQVSLATLWNWGNMVVCQIDGLNQYGLAWSDGSGWPAVPNQITTAGRVEVLSGRKSGTIATGYLNGSLTGTKTVPATMVQQIGQMVLGNRAGLTYAFNGQIAEVLVYNRALTDAERTQIEQQLMTKYISP
jgi:hypothetical protein